MNQDTSPAGPQFVRVLGGLSMLRATVLQKATSTPGCPIEKFWLADLADVPAVARHRVERMAQRDMLPGFLHPAVDGGIRYASIRDLSADPSRWHVIVEIGGLDHLTIGETPLPPSAFVAALSRMGEPHEAAEAALNELREAGSLGFGELARRHFRNLANLRRHVPDETTVAFHGASPEEAVADCIAVAGAVGRVTFLAAAGRDGDAGLDAVHEGIAQAGLETAKAPAPAGTFAGRVLQGRAAIERVVSGCEPISGRARSASEGGSRDTDGLISGFGDRFPKIARHADRLALPLGRMCSTYVDTRKREGRSTKMFERFLDESDVLSIEPA